MEGAAGNKYKNCSLDMKQRIGIAMALLGNPELLVLDEPINGLDADGMRIMREVLVDIAKSGATIVISSHILGELEKIATHYGIVRGGKMIAEMTAKELDASCRTFVAVKATKKDMAKALLMCKYLRVEKDENEYIRVYDQITPEEIVSLESVNEGASSETEKVSKPEQEEDVPIVNGWTPDFKPSDFETYEEY
jgi:ABC-type multidrug transport system ATPase subunit